jgi:D-alanyl-lipoteichoic acid acyltransferase DltB (MBOAT superfamily)
MIHTSHIAIVAGWLMIGVACSWLLPPRLRVKGIALSGAGLLICLAPFSCGFLGLSTAGSYCSARYKRGQVAVICLIVIAYVVVLWLNPDGADRGGASFLLPLGMAYYVLRLIHYMVESGKGSLRPHSFEEYACYQFFPPTLPVGPINRFDDFLVQLRRHRWDAQMASAGASRVLIGACKVVLLGNVMVNVVLAGAVARLPADHHLLSLYLDTIRFWLNIYVQFSGYSDLAIGTAAMMGFRLPENFNFPFVAKNIGQFWHRWHMTLAGWCRDYIYMPVLARWRRPPLAVAASMVVLGLWHEISLHYLIWGLYHAIGLTVWRRFHERASPRGATAAVGTAVGNGFSRVLTLHFVIFSYPVANALTDLLGVT